MQPYAGSSLLDIPSGAGGVGFFARLQIAALTPDRSLFVDDDAA